MLFTDNMMIPAKAAHPYAAETMMNYVYEPDGRGEDRRLRELHLAGRRASRRSSPRPTRSSPNNPLIFPPDAIRAKLHPYPALSPTPTSATMQDGDGAGDRRLSRCCGCRCARAPAAAALAVPRPGPALAARLLRDPAGQPGQRLAADAATPSTGYTFTWPSAPTRTRSRPTRRSSCARSATRRAATVLCLIIAFPLAYFIAFKAGRFKNLMLLLIVLPFFMTYVAADGRLAADPVRQRLGRARACATSGCSAPNGRLLATRTAVIAGITYNFLPFMALPLYVSLEKIDRRLIEAATDLYASRATAFRKVTLPLALPGIFAGSLLTFIPAVRRLHQRRAARARRAST